jgi:8-oxo-dGTP diphosphatase
VQIIVNCLTPYGDGFVMLQKPRRGWWVLPGGKVDPDETWPMAAKREMFEEVGLVVDNLRLRGIHLIHIAPAEPDGMPTRRLIAQFSAQHVGGQLLPESREGKVDVITPEQLLQLPMDEGDRQMVSCTLDSVRRDDPIVYFGLFHYDADQRLLDWSIEGRLEAALEREA